MVSISLSSVGSHSSASGSSSESSKLLTENQSSAPEEIDNDRRVRPAGTLSANFDTAPFIGSKTFLKIQSNVYKTKNFSQ